MPLLVFIFHYGQVRITVRSIRGRIRGGTLGSIIFQCPRMKPRVYYPTITGIRVGEKQRKQISAIRGVNMSMKGRKKNSTHVECITL